MLIDYKNLTIVFWSNPVADSVYNIYWQLIKDFFTIDATGKMLWKKDNKDNPNPTANHKKIGMISNRACTAQLLA